MNDTIRYMPADPIHRKHHHGELTFSLIYAFTRKLLTAAVARRSLHGKGSLLNQMPGDLWQKFANLAVAVHVQCGPTRARKLLLHGKASSPSGASEPEDRADGTCCNTIRTPV